MGKKILIVDDSRTIRQQLRFTLEKGGFEVTEADDGVTGLEMINSSSDILLVISDINMKTMSGLDMLDKIKAEARYASLPVLMLTTEGSGAMVDRAKKAGAKGWVIKPFQPEQIIAAVNKLIE